MAPEAAAPPQFWVRSAEGRTWGPLAPATLELMIDHGVVAAPFELSRDGLQFEAGSLERLHALLAGRAGAAPPPVLSAAQGPAGGSAMRAAVAVARAAIPAEARRAAPTPAPQTVSDDAEVTQVNVPIPPEAAPPPAPKPRVIQAAPPIGRLEQLSALRLYYLVAAAEADGLLTLDEGASRVRIWFKHGTPHAVDSRTHGLGNYLVEQNAVSAEQFAAASQKAPTDPVGALFASGQINPSAVFPLIQQHAQAVLHRALQLVKGPFAFDPAAAVPASGFPLGQRWEILVGAARRMDALALKLRLEGRQGFAPRVDGSTGELRLTALELRLLGAFDGRTRLGDILAAVAAQEGEQLQRLAVLLGEIDRLAWDAVGTPAPAAAPAAARATPRPAPAHPAAVAPAPRPPPPVVPAAPKAAAPVAKAPAAAPKQAPPKLAAPAQPSPAPRPPPPKTGPPKAGPPKASPPVAVPAAQAPAEFLADLRQKNHFERLGEPPSPAVSPRLKAAYFQLAKLYHPDMLPPDAPPDERKQREEILALLNEAYRTLEDPARRKEYLDQLAAEEAGLGDVDIEAILKAEEDFQRALVLVKGNKIEEGLRIIESCIALNEREGEFYAWRGYARFLLASDRKAAFAPALVDVQKALKLTPRCLPAHLLQGQMHKLIGDEAAARVAFQKVLELDPRNVDAQRELRLFDQRSKK